MNIDLSKSRLVILLFFIGLFFSLSLQNINLSFSSQEISHPCNTKTGPHIPKKLGFTKARMHEWPNPSS